MHPCICLFFMPFMDAVHAVRSGAHSPKRGSGAAPQNLQSPRSGAPAARRNPAAWRTRRAPRRAVKQRHSPTRAQHDRRRATQSREKRRSLPQKLQVPRSGAPVARRNPAARRTHRAPCHADVQQAGPTRIQHDRRRTTQSREKRRSLPQKQQVSRSGAPVARRNPAARRTRRAQCRADEQRYSPTRIQPDRRHATQSREKNRRFSRGDPAPDAPCSQ